jgi:hypothetical protein
VFIDGPHHEQPLQERLDQEKRQALVDAGMTVVVFDQHTESWDALIAEYRWLFGEGEVGARNGSGGGSPPPPQSNRALQHQSGGPAIDPEQSGVNLAEALDAVFAQHQQLFGKEAQP